MTTRAEPLRSAPPPLAKCVKSRENTCGSGFVGVAWTRLEGKLLPARLTALTSKRQVVPLTRPLTVWVVSVEPVEILRKKWRFYLAAEPPKDN